MLRGFWMVVWRELVVALRQKADIFNPLWFFLMVITLFPLSVGPEPQLLARIAPGIIWVGALLSSLLALERLFRDDLLDGSLEQMLLLPEPLSLLVLGKIAAHWLLTGVPLLLVSPVLGLLLSLDMATYWGVVATLALGTPILSLLGGVGVALTVGLGKGGVLLSLLILPLYLPVLIFATAAIDAASLGLPLVGYLAILGALLVGALLVAPLAISGALRVSLD